MSPETNNPGEVYRLTAADFADTGQWRLLLKIEKEGLCAFLENTLHPECPRQKLCEAKWDSDSQNILTNLEETVFSNPRLLDDFATKIVIFNQNTLFLPTVIAEETTRSEAELYQKVYPADDSDIMTDSDRDITAVWSQGKGVKGFLLRTFPGARITCNLMNRVRELRKDNHGLTLLASVREKETDLVLLDGVNLISASTHNWQKPSDIPCRVINLLDVYGYELQKVNIITKGEPLPPENWKYIREEALSFKCE